MKSLRLLIAVSVCVASSPVLARAYSVLTHEQVIDLVWQDHLRPMLLKRFPLATPDDLKKAHAFAYGGSLVQDMGYYPFGKKYFSDLTLYVPSGYFIINILKKASDLNEVTFEFGALAHYPSIYMCISSVNE